MNKQKPHDIAIIGMACRFPRAKNIQQYWQNLISGAETARLIPADRWQTNDHFDPQPGTAGKSISKWGCFLDDIWGFDPEFFNLTKEESLFIDPQHRILLELAYETLAESGYTAEAFNGKRVGVFIAIAQEDYKNDAIAHLFSDQKSPATTLANNLRSLAAGRIADSLNLKGPTFAIDSACSSALIAMHYARLSLQNGDCDFALVGGVNLNIGPTSFLAFSNAGALSPSAKSYLFDERNHGILLGEGAGMLLLTPAHAADRPILAILKGSAVNNDGQSHGPMTPNTAGQQQVMQAAYETSGINPADLGYIEAHGTGTPIGDVVEARTLNRFFGRLKEIDPPTRYVGSMKPNVGHLLSAAGIASLIKVVLALHHKQIPPSLNCQQPRKKLRLGQVGLIINDQPILWETGKGKARLAGINAFAFGGTNAHVILQEATDQPERQPLPPPVFTRQHLRISPQAPPGYAKLTRPSKELSSWLHRVVWQPTPLPAIDSTILDTPLPTVITAADGEAGFRLANLLKNQGLDCEFCQPHQLTQQQNSFRLLLVAADYEFVRSTAKVLTQLSQGSVDSISIISHQGPLEPDAALIAGFSHALNDELHIPVQFISFDDELSNAPLLAELIWPTATSTVWWHKDARFVRKVVPLPADQAASITPISKDGVYLITGGGSGVGAAIAKGLALDIAPTLILVGRKSLSDALERADFLGKLRWAGATADYIAADVSDAAQVDQLIRQTLEKYGRLDGVIHAAGVVAGERLATSTAESCQRIFAPKVDGAKNLHSALKRANVDPALFVSFSSISAVLPGISGGLSTYAAANSYLDGFAHQHGYQSLNWTIWTESGQGSANGLVDHLARLGLQGVNDKEGYELFKSAVGLPQNQIVVVNPQAIKTNPVGSDGGGFNLAPKRIGGSDPVRPYSKLSSDHDHIFDLLTKLLADELDIEPAEVPLDKSFANMGLDSMGAMELVVKLEEEGLGSLPATLFFEHNTITKLAQHLSISHAEIENEELPMNVATQQPPTTSNSPLLPTQRAFLSQQISNPDSVAYAYLRFSIQGGFDLERGDFALKQLFMNHTQLRARFSFDPGGVGAEQRIVPFEQLVPRPKIEPLDGLLLPKFEDQLVNRPMSLIGENRDSLFQVNLVKDENKEPHLIFLLHHIVADGWSLSVLVQEFWASYFGKETSKSAPLLSDYRNIIGKEKESPLHQTNIDWWQHYLTNHPTIQPTDAPAGQHKIHRFKLNPADTQRIKEQAKANNVTLFHWLLAAQFKTLSNGQGSMEAIGVAEARRDYNLPQIERLVGCLSDIFPLRLEVDPAEPLTQLAQRVKNDWLEVHKHTHISSAEIASLLPTSQIGQALYSAAFSFSHFPRFVSDDVTDETFQIVDILGRTGTSQTTLSLVCWTLADELYFTWNYRDDLYSADQIEQLTGQYLDTLPLPLSPPVQQVPSFVKQIAKQIKESADCIAIQAPKTAYQALSAQIGRCLNQLKQHGFQPNDVVAFIGEPGLPALSALLATFWGGGSWLPLDPATPAERLTKNLNTAGAKFLLGQTNPIDDNDLPSSVKTVHIEQTDHACTLQSPVLISPSSTAYIIFTSGSTGEQKGVPISYDSLDRYLNWAVETLDYRPDDVQMWGTSLSFDATLRQCLAPLMSGGSMLPLGRNDLLDPPKLSQKLITHRVTKWSSVPTLWKQMLSYWELDDWENELALEQVQLGGEALPMSLVDRWMALHPADVSTEFVNLYGPTENTINAAYFKLNTADRGQIKMAAMPIGKPLNDVTLKVVNKSGKPSKAGEQGELLISGRLLTTGYLKSEHLQLNGCFHSGDLVEVLPSGDLLFIGRLDNQIKLRGYRIELEEIEQVLLAHPQVAQAAVVLQEDGQSQELIAFVSSDCATLENRALRSYLSQKLPSYMLPQHFKSLATIPQLPSGKVDRVTLKKLQLNSSAQTQTLDPSWLGQLWQKILKVDHIESNSDFFALGGDSLNIMELMVLLRKAGYQVDSPADLFQQRTLSAQATFLQGKQDRLAQSDPLPVGNRQSNPFPLSPAQVGFWMAHSLNPDASTTWHANFWLDGVLDRPKFTEAVQILVGRHPMLRTVCLANERPPRQQTIVPDRPLPVTFETVTLDPNHTIAQVTERVSQALSAPFDLTQWPLIRLHLVETSADHHLWFVAGDHFIGDGMSGWIFGRELFQIYDDLVAHRPLSLKPLEATFRDYVELAQTKAQNMPADSTQFWQSMFGTPYPPLDAWKQPTPNTDEAWHKHTIELDQPTTDRLKSTALTHNLTPHDLLLALFYQQLAQLTNQTDLIVGTAVSGREHPLPDLLNIFGSFATILPIRFQLEADDSDPLKTVGDLLNQARSHTCSPRQIAQLAHPDLSLEALTGRRFFFSFIGFESMGMLESETLSVDWERSQSDIVPPNDKTDVMLVGRVLDGNLRLAFTAGAHALDAAQLAKFAEAFETGLKQPLDAPRLDSALIGYLPSRPEVETHIKRLGLPLSADQARELLFSNKQPRLLDSLSCSLGRSSTITLPYFADELATLPTADLCAKITQAVEISTSHGASSIALAGMLPSLTDYGHALPNLPNVALTTGHSVTVVAVVRNTQHAIAKLGLETQNLTIAFLGCGSIGSSALRLFLRHTQHPAALMLCDAAASDKRLQRLEQSLRDELGFVGEIVRLHGDGQAPADLYTADVIVGAASQPNLLDVAKLQPGTLVIDDSFPSCFDSAQALARMQTQRDVLLVGGGLLDIGRLERAAHVPQSLAPFSEQLLAELPSFGTASCQLEGILRAARPELPPTLGLVDEQDVELYWRAVTELGFKAAPLHLGSFLIKQDLIDAVIHFQNLNAEHRSHSLKKL